MPGLKNENNCQNLKYEKYKENFLYFFEFKVFALIFHFSVVIHNLLKISVFLLESMSLVILGRIYV